MIPMQATVFTDREKLAESAHIWEQIPRDCWTHLCNQPLWQLSALRHYGATAQVHALLFKDSQSSESGFLPLVVERSSLSKLPVRKARFFENRIHLSTPLCSPAMLEKLWEHLPRPAAWPHGQPEVIHLTVTEEQMHIIDKTHADEYFWILRQEKNTLGLYCEDSDAFLNKILSANSRKHLRRLQKRYAQLPAFKHQFLCGKQLAGNFQTYWLNFLELYQKSWKHRSHRSLTRVKAEERFFYDVFRGYSQSNQASLSLLSRADELIGALWWLNIDGVQYAVLNAYDASFKHLSPGIYSILTDILHFISQGISQFDFLGSQPYKEHFSNRRRLYYDLYLIKKSLYGVILKTIAPYSPFFRQCKG